jgi:elongation factor G
MLEPGTPTEGISFGFAASETSLPSEYVEAVQEGAISACEVGPLIGFPVTCVRIIVFRSPSEVSYSSSEAARTAASQAMKIGFEKSGMKILEPIMDVEVTSPTQFAGSIIHNLQGRRGQISRQSMKAHDTVLRAYVPLANMFGINSELSSIAQRQATYIMAFSHYAELPRNIAPDPYNFPPAVGMRA